MQWRYIYLQFSPASAELCHLGHLLRHLLGHGDDDVALLLELVCHLVQGLCCHLCASVVIVYRQDGGLQASWKSNERQRYSQRWTVKRQSCCFLCLCQPPTRAVGQPCWSVAWTPGSHDEMPQRCFQWPSTSYVDLTWYSLEYELLISGTR